MAAGSATHGALVVCDVHSDAEVQMSNALRLAVSAALLSMVLSGCGGGGSDAARTTGGGIATVVASGLTFQPKDIRVAVNQRTTVRLQNKDKILHDWTVEQISVSAVETRGSDSHQMSGGMVSGGMMSGSAGGAALHIAADAGRSAEVTFVPGQTGEFSFYCTVPGHREAGMQGRLLVE